MRPTQVKVLNGDEEKSLVGFLLATRRECPLNYHIFWAVVVRIVEESTKVPIYRAASFPFDHHRKR